MKPLSKEQRAHRLLVQRAHAEAARRLRALFQEDYDYLLDEVYDEMGLAVTRRASKVEMEVRRQSAARSEMKEK